jgi:hypothetical protein
MCKKNKLCAKKNVDKNRLKIKAGTEPKRTDSET